MAADDPASKRHLTDESLRAERDRVDQTLADKLAAVDERADAVIVQVRARADAELAAARSKTDRLSPRGPYARIAQTVQRERAKEDDAVQKERDEADEVLRLERAAYVAVLAGEREETDRDLSNERAHSDAALAMRDDFMGIVSHDLRNMLHNIVGYAALIAAEASAGKPMQHVLEHAARIQRSGSRMSRLVGDLVDVASIEAGALMVTLAQSDPVQVVTEAVDTFQAHAWAHGISIATELPSSCAHVQFDGARILQVLINLISNAIKFTSPNGKVVVRLERIPQALRFTVSDTGVGIPEDKLHLIFHRFHQLNKNDRRGVGLGLYISRCIVEGHGGRIWAQSVAGGGSTFSFTLPVAS